jgi:hypothetical protein
MNAWILVRIHGRSHVSVSSGYVHPPKIQCSPQRPMGRHAHLGNIAFDRGPEIAIRHYEVGFRIGELSFGESFDGLLRWGWIDNRPFLRCLKGFGLCLWRLGRFEEAENIFERMLWLNPSDNQGVRFLIDDVQAGLAERPHRTRVARTSQQHAKLQSVVEDLNFRNLVIHSHSLGYKTAYISSGHASDRA